MKKFLNNSAFYQITIFFLILIFFLVQFNLINSNLDKSRLYIILNFSPVDEKYINQLNEIEFQNNVENQFTKNFSQKYKYKTNPIKKYSKKFNYSFHLIYFFDDKINSDMIIKIKNHIDDYFINKNINHVRVDLNLIND